MIQDIILISRFFTPRWILIIFSSVIILLPIISAITNRKALSNSLRIISFYLFGSLFFEILCWAIILLPFSNHQNHWAVNTFNIYEFICLSYYFLSRITNFRLKQLIKCITVLSFFLIIIFTVINIQDINRYDNLTHSIVYITLIFFTLLNFYEILYSDETLVLSNYAYFWIASGILIYFSGTFFVNLFGDVILFSVHLKDYWIIYYILLIIFRIILAIGLWFSKTPPQLSPSSK